MRPPNAAKSAALVILAHLGKHMSTAQITDLMDDLTKVPGNAKQTLITTRIKKEIMTLTTARRLVQTF